MINLALIYAEALRTADQREHAAELLIRLCSELSAFRFVDAYRLHNLAAYSADGVGRARDALALFENTLAAYHEYRRAVICNFPHWPLEQASAGTQRPNPFAIRPFMGNGTLRMPPAATSGSAKDGLLRRLRAMAMDLEGVDLIPWNLEYVRFALAAEDGEHLDKAR